MRSYYIIGFIAALTVFMLQLPSPTKAQQEASNPKNAWEYKVVDPGTSFSGNDDGKFSEAKLVLDIENKINKLGTDGWELLCTTQGIGTPTGIWIFKRQKPSSK